MMSGKMHTGVPGRSYRPVAELLDMYRRRDAAKVALVDVGRDTRITFGELATAVDCVAGQLASMGMRKDARILLLANAGIEKIIMWLAIWRIGAVVCPLDLLFIRTAASTVLKTISPDLVLSDGKQTGLEVLREIPARIVQFGAWEPGASGARISGDQLLFDAHTARGEVSLSPSPAITDLACMACTSGTTGIPKIVVYDHQAYWKNGLNSIDLLDLGEHDRTLEYRSLGWYSAQILSLMPFLQTGLTLHLAQKFSYRSLPDWIERYRITVCAGVPTVINILLNQPIADAPKRFASLRAMTSSTAPLATAHWTRFEQTYGVRLFNLYGSSETGWICGNRHPARRIGTVGQPVGDVRLDILSEAGTPCPPGVPGQMVVNSDNVALGYLQSDGSLHGIRGKPFALRDIAVTDPDGYVRVLGRSDDLIIRGGVKISPTEIEEVALMHPDVLEAAAVGIPDPIYGQQPVCFIVPRPDRSPETDSLLAHCAMHLPREKVPVRAVIIAELPRSPRGKLLRDRLIVNARDSRP